MASGNTLTPQQRQILARILAVGHSRGESPKKVKAAVETGIVESNLSNPSGGTGDSAGWRQERASLYPNPTNLNASIGRFYNEADALAAKYGTAGALAAAVQRPAAQYRGRYQAVSGQAQGLLGGAAGAPASGPTTSTKTVPGVDRSAQRSALISQFLGQGGPDNTDALLNLATQLPGLKNTAARKVTTTTPGAPSGGSGGYVNPFGSSLKGPGRVDEGVDPVIQGPIRAIGDAKVVNISHNFYKGQPYIVYQLANGPHAGKYVYVSELVTPHVKVGQTVRAGDVIATGNGAIETGWAGGPQGGYLPVANRAQGGSYTEGKVTGAGRSFAGLLKQLGANAGG
jgi:hypothetical protein